MSYLLILILLIFLIFISAALIMISLDYCYHISFEYDKQYRYLLSFKTILFYLEIKNDYKNNLKENYLAFRILNFKKLFKYNFINSKKNSRKKFTEKFNFLKKDQSQNKKIKKHRIEDYFELSLKILRKDNLEHLFRFIIFLLKEISPNNLNLNLSSAYPYYNALILSYYYSFISTFNFNNLKLEINWEKIYTSAEVFINGQIRPIKIFYLIFKFIFSLQTIKLIFQIYKFNKKSADKAA